MTLFHSFLFLLYLIIFTYLITRLSFFKQSSLSKRNLGLLFIFKILGGFAFYAFYMLPQYHANADTFSYHKLSLAETDLLLSNPVQFIKELFINPYADSNGLFAGTKSYWNNLKTNAFIKFLAVLNVFSFKNYFVNIIFFNFIVFTGFIALYRVIKKHTTHTNILLAALFFIPSVWFYSGGIMKDGLIIAAVCFSIYVFDKGIQNGFKLRYWTILFLSIIALFALRNFVAFALITSLATWFISAKTNKPKLIFTTVALLMFAGFCISFYIDSINFGKFIATKQNEFYALEGTSKMNVELLQPTLESFISYLPSALDAAFLQPHFSFNGIAQTLPFFLENMALLLLFTLAIIFRSKTEKPAISYALIFFSTILILITGYTVTFAGAIVRYKTIYLPFLITALILMIDRKKIFRLFRK